MSQSNMKNGMLALDREQGLPRVLIVDDEPAVAATIARLTARHGVDCAIAHTVERAVELLRSESFDLVFADVVMPGASGLDVAKAAKERDPAIQVIIVTGNTDTETAVEAIRIQADDYLIKPFDAAQLGHSLRRALEHRRLLIENREHRERLEVRVRQQARSLERMYLSSIHALVSALEAKDKHTAGHSSRVAEYAVAIGRSVGGLDLEAVRVGAHLHDIGKIGLPDRVLGKTGPLTESERLSVQEHPVTGVRILSPMLEDRDVLDIVRSHHERWDGKGYPDGLRGEEIPRVARVVCVADTLDAITTPRPYREARDWAVALREIERHAGGQFDPQIAAAAVDVFEGELVQSRGRVREAS